MRFDGIRPVQSKAAHLDEAGNSDALTQQEAQKRVLEFAQRIKNKEASGFDFTSNLPASVKWENRKSIYAEMYAAIFNVAKTHPELTQELGELEGTIAQNPQMMHPRHLLDIASDVMWDPRVHNYLKGSMIHGLGYALRFMKSPEYEKAIANKLDFTNTENFSNTAHFLEFMQNLYNIGDEYSYSGDNIVVSRVHEALQQSVNKGQGSYLLNVRAQELLAEMDGRSWISSGSDRMPFLVTKDRYAWHKEDGLYVAASAERENLESLIREFRDIEAKIKPPQHLVDEAVAAGEDEVMWMPDQNLMRVREEKYREISSVFTDRLAYKDLAPGGTAVSADERASEEHDFAYLQRRPIRETIKEDFEIEIGNLPLQDQYRLLKVLKTVEYGKATPLLLEATRAMWKAGVEDYLTEIRGGALEVTAGNAISNEDAEVIRVIHEAQYKGKYNETLTRKLRQGLSDALQSPDSRFYLYRKNGEIVTYVRFDSLVQSDDSGKHMASFMVNPKFEGGALGQALLDVALQKETEGGISIFAECDVSLGNKYQEFGFEIIDQFVEDDVPTLRIQRTSGVTRLAEAA